MGDLQVTGSFLGPTSSGCTIALRGPSVRPGARSCNPLGSGSSLLRWSEPTVVLRDSHPALCLPPLDDGVGKRQMQNVPIAPFIGSPGKLANSWQMAF
jgi:hypothetical protein